MKRDTSLHDLELWEYVLHHFKMLPPLTDTMREAFNPTSWQQDLHHSLTRSLLSISFTVHGYQPSHLSNATSSLYIDKRCHP
ncbi:hypothetical protein AS033_10195 [Exiguobacterium indicum]|uniref:Uncharacterized protein n=1 Tax=Exiguobacterium indicum TaxID=296995 RepID=A0A0V8GEN5_9BACL|nr:hypothetical protein [Exiguobacterium enclense]KSU48693.1 hypothetical protein AS033_10195 [Exiguobacterium enclense]SDC80796.1 hypothetical protein SAMN05216342_2076 [Exiguobacterium enclense]